MLTPIKTDPVLRFGVRHRQCLLLFCCQFMMYSVLINMSLAIVPMTDRSKANPDFEEFDWDEQTRATILSSFFWGYIVSQIPCGSLITYFGSKYLLLTGCASNAILTLITPWCTHWGGSTALLTIRILQGVFQGALYPSCHSLIANWAPLSERSRLSVLVYPGAQIGTVVTLSTGGLIASSSLGWPGIFYIWGTGGLVWCIVWLFYGANGPSEHKTISVEERDYILQSRDAHTEKLPTPWKNIFRSPAFYALTITHACCSYSFWTITTVTPTYMKGVFGLDIQKNALLSAIPPIAMFVLSHIFGMLVRLCMERLKLPLRFIRILFNTVGSEIPAAALIGLGFVTGNHPALAIFLLTVAYGVSSAIYFGYYVNHMDLCPTHAGILMAVTNSVATGSGIFSTLAVGWFVKDETNPQHWQIIFSIGAGLFTIGTFAFAFFGRFENQNWVTTIEESSTQKRIQDRDNFNNEK